MRNNKDIQTDRYTTKRQLLITPALSIARQKLQDYFEGYPEFHLKIFVYLFHEFSRNPSRYSAEIWLSGTATCAQTFNVLCNVQ
jgi:hypothetical protein